MSNSKDIINNGQPHFISSTSKRHNRTYCIFPLIIAFITWIGFVIFLYYLDTRHRVDIQEFNNKINDEMQIYNEKINHEIQLFKKKIKCLTEEMKLLKHQLEKQQTSGMQIRNNLGLLQESKSDTYKAIAVENIEEYPEIEEIKQYDLTTDTNDYEYEESAENKNHQKNNNSKIIFENDHPPNNRLPTGLKILVPTDNSTENLKNARHKISKRHAELSRTNNFNVVNTTSTKLEKTTGSAKNSTNTEQENVHLINAPQKIYDEVNVTYEKPTSPKSTILQQNLNQDEISSYEKSRPAHEKTSKKKNNGTDTNDNRQYILKSNKYPLIRSEYSETETIRNDKFNLNHYDRGRNQYTSHNNHEEPDTLLSDYENYGGQTQITREEITEIDNMVVAAHFGADSSAYSIRTHQNTYEGNGRLHHPTGEYKDWKPSSWFENLQMHKYFILKNGNVTVLSPGLYYVYAQIFYSDSNDVNGYQILKNAEVVLRCITTTYAKRTTNAERSSVASNTCYTGGVIYCEKGDQISIKTYEKHRQILLESSRSFFGIFKVGAY